MRTGMARSTGRKRDGVTMGSGGSFQYFSGFEPSEVGRERENEKATTSTPISVSSTARG